LLENKTARGAGTGQCAAAADPRWVIGGCIALQNRPYQGVTDSVSPVEPVLTFL
jgi:hypothetical protein